MMDEIEVIVCDGLHRLGRWVCDRVLMPDGAPGAMWRGMAYQLLPGNRIDISEQTVVAPSPQPYAVVPGVEVTWVLIQGLTLHLTEAHASLARGGVAVTRTGRWLGDTVDGVAFDWFVCCAGSISTDTVAALVGGTMVAVDDDGPARLAVMEQRLLDLLAKVRELETRLRRPSQPPPQQAAVAVEPEPDQALEQALAQLAELEARLEQPRQPPDRPVLAPRIADELAAVLGMLRPDIKLLRDSWQVAVGEFQSRTPFWRALNALPVSGSRPDSWKMLRGAERWWECHLSTGRDDNARLYARFDLQDRRWDVLLGWKVEQSRDIAWLLRQG